MAAAIVTCPNCGRRNRVRPNPAAVPKCANCGERLPWDVAADAESFAEEILAPVPVIVDFWAPWCAPCRAVSPVLERLARTNAGRLKLVRLNVDEAPEIAAEHRAMSIPTMVVMRDGAEVDRVVGALPGRQLEERFARHIAAPAGEGEAA